MPRNKNVYSLPTHIVFSSISLNQAFSSPSIKNTTTPSVTKNKIKYSFHKSLLY